MLEHSIATQGQSRLLGTVIFLALCFVAPLDIRVFKALSFALLIVLCVYGLYRIAARPQTLKGVLLGGSLILIFMFIWMLLHSQEGKLDVIWFIRYFSVIVLLTLFRNDIARLTPSFYAVVFVIVAQFLGNIYFIATQQGLFLNGANRYFGLTDRMIVLSGLINFVCAVYILTIYREEKGRSSLFLYLPMLLALFNVTVTSSRSTLIATVLFILFFFNISMKIGRLLGLSVLLAIFIGLAVVLAPDTMARFATIADFSEGSNFSRIQFIIAGLNMFLEHPFAGVGPGVSHRLLEQYIPWEESPSMHFDLLLVAAELGIFGLLSLVWSMSKLRLLRPILIVVILMLSTQNMFYYAPYFMIILAALSVATRSVDNWKSRQGQHVA